MFVLFIYMYYFHILSLKKSSFFWSLLKFQRSFLYLEIKDTRKFIIL